MFSQSTMTLLIGLSSVSASPRHLKHSNQPVACFEHEVSRSYFVGQAEHEIGPKTTLGFKVNSVSSSWKVQVEVSDRIHLSPSCVITFEIGSQGSQRITGKCSTKSHSKTDIVKSLPVNFLNPHQWNYVLLVKLKDTLVIMPQMEQDGNAFREESEQETLFLENTGIKDLLLKWRPNDVELFYNFNCETGCLLQSQNTYAHFSNDNMNTLLYFWRGTSQSSLKIKFEHQIIQVPPVQENEDLVPLQEDQRWIILKTNGSKFLWSLLSSSPANHWSEVTWTENATNYFTRYGYDITIAPDSLVTRCNPYRLPCYNQPHQCYINDGNDDCEDASFKWWLLIVLALVCVFILLGIFVAVVTSCVFARRKNKMHLGSSGITSNSQGSAIELGSMKRKTKENQYKSTVHLSNQIARNYAASSKQNKFDIDQDEFTSDHVYEDPMECLGTSNEYLNTIKSNRSFSRHDQLCQQSEYANVPLM